MDAIRINILEDYNMCLSIQAKRPIVAERQGSLQQRSSTPSSHFSFAMVSGKHCKARQPQHLHRNISAAFLAWHFVPFAVSQAHPTLGFRPTAIPKVSDSPVLSCKASNLSPRSATFVILSCIVSIVSSICDWIAWIYMSTWSANYPSGRCHNPIRSPRTGVPSAQGKRT